MNAATPPGGSAFSRHGGNVHDLAARLGLPLDQLLDFSASINPLGMPAGARSAAAKALAEAVHYPPIDGAPLVRSLARHHRVPENRLLAGAGSTEFLFLLPLVLRPRRSLVVTPAFSEYERALDLAGTVVDRLPLDPARGFVFDSQRLLDHLRPETGLVVAANPGNPSGVGISPEILLDLARNLEGKADLLVDEAFVDFFPGHSVLPRVTDHANLWILRSLTKFYAIPGLRCGYLAGPAPGIERLAKARIPWSLSTPALAAAQACLEEDGFRDRTLKAIPPLRSELALGLEALGLEVFPSVANYLLVRLPPARSSRRLAEQLQKRGLLIRTCDDFHGLDDRYFRIAVRSGDQNRLLLGALSEALPQVSENSESR